MSPEIGVEIASCHEKKTKRSEFLSSYNYICKVMR